MSDGDDSHILKSYQTMRRGPLENIRRLQHLNHERAPVVEQVVLGPYTRENSVDDPNLCRLGGDEGASLCQDGNERRLAQQR